MNTTKGDLECILFDEKEEPKALPLSLLEEITNAFSDKLQIGRGGYAVVYKAHLCNEDIAVKRLTNTYEFEEEFHREVECLMKARHRNIIRFLGYCADTQGNMERLDKKLVMADTQQRLLCFEYLPNGSLDGYITDASGGLEWTKRYRIIRGICEGLLHLHEINILHLDLKPSNILLDNEMTPKITDFGLSRCFDEGQTHGEAKKVTGTLGYLAPEFYQGVITHSFDLYSLGVIITELLTGAKWCESVEDVLESWSKRLEISKGNTLLEQIRNWLENSKRNTKLELEQIRVCTEIAIECTNFDPDKRPISMKHIIDRLGEVESTEVIKLLDVHPLVLRFTFESNKVIPCSLHLTNNTNEQVAFRLTDKTNKSGSCFVRLPLYGLVPPRSTYTLVVTTKERNDLERTNICMILESTIFPEEQMRTFQSQHNDTFFGNVKEMGNQVQEVKLIGVNTPPQEILSSKPISPGINILDLGKWYKQTTLYGKNSVYCLDTNQAEQWIITGGSRGYVGIWNYETKRKVDSLKLSLENDVTCIKFIARKQWFVATAGHVHVYSYESKLQKITSFIAGTWPGHVPLAVHPIQPYLLTVCGDLIKLWDWDKDWECIKILSNYKYTTMQAICISNSIIAFPRRDHQMEVRSFDSPDDKYTTLSGHSDIVNCLDLFTCGDQEYLVSGSDDHTAKIWEMELKVCVCTLEPFTSPVMSVVYQPNLQILICGSKDGSIYFWNTSNTRICSRSPRLERIINIGYGGAVRALACFMGSVVIGKEDLVAVAMLKDENKNYQEESSDYSEVVSTSKVSVGSNELLYVHPLELRFDTKRNEMCSLHLTNKTDEHVAFRVTNKLGRSWWDRCFVELPLRGIVPPGSTCLLCSILEDKTIVILDCDEFFDEAKELGHAVQELALKFVCTPTEQVTMFKRVISPRIKIISLKKRDGILWCLDAHPTEPWIVTTHIDGDVCIWNSDTQELVHKFEVSERAVTLVKIIPGKQWIVAGTTDQLFHVYDCASIPQIKNIGSFGGPTYNKIAIHPTKPYLLSSAALTVDLWDGDKSWECTRTFESDSICGAFNPVDPNSFASLTCFGAVEVWSLDDSSECTYAMSGHSEAAKCLAYFTRGDRQYLITGSKDCTAKIWDLQEKTCIHTLTGFMSPVGHVISLPGQPYLVTCSKIGTVQVWSTIDFRLKRTVNISGAGKVRGLACLMGSRRIVIGQRSTITFIDIDDDDEATASEANSEDSTCAKG